MFGYTNYYWGARPYGYGHWQDYGYNPWQGGAWHRFNPFHYYGYPRRHWW